METILKLRKYRRYRKAKVQIPPWGFDIQINLESTEKKRLVCNTSVCQNTKIKDERSEENGQSETSCQKGESNLK